VPFVFLMTSIMAVSGQTLVNPSFEDPADASDIAKGWNRWGDWINRETGWTPVKDGACIIGYHHWQIEKSDNSGLWQEVKVTPGKKYAFSIYANDDRSGKDSKDAESVELRLETTVNGQQSTVASKVYKVTDLATGGDWSQLKVEATAPNDTLRVLVVVQPDKNGPRGGAVKFDQAELKSSP